MMRSDSSTRATTPRPRARTFRVFLSYRKDEADRAEALRRAAEQFEDVELCSLPYAEPIDRDWHETFGELIESSDGLVCLVGPTTGHSANIAWELNEAARRDLPIVLVGTASAALAAAVDVNRLDVLDDATPERVLSRLVGASG